VGSTPAFERNFIKRPGAPGITSSFRAVTAVGGSLNHFNASGEEMSPDVATPYTRKFPCADSLDRLEG